jgi:hypothetical protein
MKFVCYIPQDEPHCCKGETTLLFLLEISLILVGMPEGKRPLGRQRRRWVDNIKMDIREIGWDGVDLIDMTQDRD